MTSPLISSRSSQQSPTLSPPLSIRMFSNIHAYQRLIKVFDYDNEPTLRYKRWKGRNVFLCSGSIMLGCHWRHLLGSLALTVISWIQYILLLVPFLHCHSWYIVSLLLAAINVILLINVSATDPGILPRQQFKNERSASVTIIHKDSTVLKSNFCKLCNIWRPSRARHCKYCDNCVDIFDHHCPWTGTCIGVRNYPQFFLFICSVAVSAIIFLFSALYLLCGWLIYDAYTNAYFLRIIVIILNIFWSCAVLSLVGTLLSFHVYLIYKGQTTNEYFRLKRAQEAANSTTTTHNTITQSLLTRLKSNIDISNKQYTFMYCMLKYCVRSTDHTISSIASSTAATHGQYTNHSQSEEGIQSDIILQRSEEYRYTPTPIESPTSAQQKQSIGATRPHNIHRNHDEGFNAFVEEAVQFTADMLLTPLFDTDDTPFPLLSPTPHSPISLAPSPPSLLPTPHRVNTSSRFAVNNSRNSGSTSGEVEAVSSTSSVNSNQNSNGNSSSISASGSNSETSNHAIPVRTSSILSGGLLPPKEQSPMTTSGIEKATPIEPTVQLPTSSVSASVDLGGSGIETESKSESIRIHTDTGLQQRPGPGRGLRSDAGLGSLPIPTHFHKRSHDEAPILHLSLPTTPISSSITLKESGSMIAPGDVHNLNPILTTGSEELALSVPSSMVLPQYQKTTNISTIVLAIATGLCLTCQTGTTNVAQCIHDRHHRPPRHLPMPGYRNYLHYGYAYKCCCIPVVPSSRLLPQWQYEGKEDSAQQEEMLQVLFRYMAEAAIEPLSSADLSV